MCFRAKKSAENGSEQGPKANFSKQKKVKFQNQKWANNWSFRAKNWPKLGKKKSRKAKKKWAKYEILNNWAEN